MKSMNSEPAPAWSIPLPGAVAGFLLTMGLMLLGAVLVLRGLLGETIVAGCAIACLSIGCFVAGIWSGHRAPNRKLIWALVSGVTVFFMVLAVGMLLLQRPMNVPRVLLSMLIAAAGAALGGVASAGLRPRHHSKHRKK